MFRSHFIFALALLALTGCAAVKDFTVDAGMEILGASVDAGADVLGHKVEQAEDIVTEAVDCYKETRDEDVSPVETAWALFTDPVETVTERVGEVQKCRAEKNAEETPAVPDKEVE